MSAAPKVSHVSAKQHAADKANLAKARAAQKGKPRSARQIAASRHNLGRARAAQKSRRAGKKFVSVKKAQAPLPDTLEQAGGLNKPFPGSRPTGPPAASGLHSLPVCAAVAVAESLRQQTGITATPEQVRDLHLLAGSAPIADVLAAVAEYGLAGRRPASFEPAAPDLFFPGLVYGIQLSAGYHAVLAVQGGMLSWGTVLPLAGTPEEAWILDWEEPGERAA